MIGKCTGGNRKHHINLNRKEDWVSRTLNQAMHVKQAWRLLQKPNSMVAKVLKAKYFHGIDYMNCKVGCNSSYV